MINFEPLRDFVRKFIKKNGRKEITGNIHQDVLIEVIDTMEDTFNKEVGRAESNYETIQQHAAEIVELQVATTDIDNRVSVNERNIEKMQGETIVDSLLSEDSIHPVQNKVVTAEFRSHRNLIDGHESRIQDNATNIAYNESEIARVEGEITGSVTNLKESIGKPDGVASLDSDGHILASQLPGSVKEILEGKLNSDAQFTDSKGRVWKAGVSGIESKEFLDKDTQVTYLWSGSQFAPVASALALGETPETAYAGSKGKKNADDIKELRNTTQIRAMIVEIRDTGFGLQASNSSDEIRNYGIKGGDVFADYKDKRYKYDAFVGGQAYFRIVSVVPSKAIEERLVIYNKTVKFERDEYEVVFDATPLFKAMQSQSTVSKEFYDSLQKAIDAKRLMRVRDENGEHITDLVVTCLKKANETQTFSAFDGRMSYILVLNTKNYSVSLDTESIGAEFSIFNNRESSIFTLDMGADNLSIREVFTDARGEELIPETGDVFNEINGEQEIVRSGLVIARTEDGSNLNLVIQSNDLVENYVAYYHLKFDYNPSRGMDSLRVTARHETIIDLALIAHDVLYELSEKVKRHDTESNQFNISAIGGMQFRSVQEAISALSMHLIDRPKSVGIEMVYVDESAMVQKYIYTGGSFVSVGSWKKVQI